MSVRAKTAAALLAAMALAPCVQAQAVSSELVPQWDLAPPSDQGMRVQAVRWAPAGAGREFGLALGMTLETGLRAGTQRLSPGLGLRWRSRLDSRRRIDVAAWRQLDTDGDDPLLAGSAAAPLTTRIEMQFVSPQGSSLGAELGAIGLQLNSSSKLQLKIRRGGPMVYYRSRF